MTIERKPLRINTKVKASVNVVNTPCIGDIYERAYQDQVKLKKTIEYFEKL